MALNKSDDPEHWRNRAEEARAVAVQMRDPPTNAVCSVLRKITKSSPNGLSNALRRSSRFRPAALVRRLRRDRFSSRGFKLYYGNVWKMYVCDLHHSLAAQLN
jgi:hypothetical protein